MNCDKKSVESAVEYMEDRLREGKPVLIGVHYKNPNYGPPNNSNRATRHVGMERDGDNIHFRFYDPGRGVQYQFDGTSENNKLTYNVKKSCVSGLYRNSTYTLSEVIKTN